MAENFVISAEVKIGDAVRQLKNLGKAFGMSEKDLHKLVSGAAATSKNVIQLTKQQYARHLNLVKSQIAAIRKNETLSEEEKENRIKEHYRKLREIQKKYHKQSINSLRKQLKDQARIIEDFQSKAQAVQRRQEADVGAGGGLIGAFARGTGLSTMARIMPALNVAWQRSRQVISVATQALGEFAEMERQVEDRLSTIKTLLDPSEFQELDRIREEAEKTAMTTGTAIEEILQGAYFALSAGAAQASNVSGLMDEISRFAGGLDTDMSTATSAVTGLMNALNWGVERSTEAMDLLAQVTRKGVVTGQEVASMMPQIAKQMTDIGLSAEQYGASIAAMTKAGIQLPESITMLKALATSLKNTASISKLMAIEGVEGFDEQKREIADLETFMNSLANTYENNKNQLMDVFDSVEARQAVNILFNPAEGQGLLNEWQNNFTELGGVSMDMWLAVADTNARELARTQEQWNVFYRDIGSTASDVMVGVQQFLTSLFVDTSQFVDATIKEIDLLNERTDMFRKLTAEGVKIEAAVEWDREAAESFLKTVEDRMELIKSISPVIAKDINAILSNKSMSTNERLSQTIELLDKVGERSGAIVRQTAREGLTQLFGATFQDFTAEAGQSITDLFVVGGGQGLKDFREMVLKEYPAMIAELQQKLSMMTGDDPMFGETEEQLARYQSDFDRVSTEVESTALKLVELNETLGLSVSGLRVEMEKASEAGSYLGSERYNKEVLDEIIERYKILTSDAQELEEMEKQTEAARALVNERIKEGVTRGQAVLELLDQEKSKVDEAAAAYSAAATAWVEARVDIPTWEGMTPEEQAATQAALQSFTEEGNAALSSFNEAQAKLAAIMKSQAEDITNVDDYVQFTAVLGNQIDILEQKIEAARQRRIEAEEVPVPEDVSMAKAREFSIEQSQKELEMLEQQQNALKENLELNEKQAALKEEYLDGIRDQIALQLEDEDIGEDQVQIIEDQIKEREEALALLQEQASLMEAMTPEQLVQIKNEEDRIKLLREAKDKLLSGELVLTKELNETIGKYAIQMKDIVKTQDLQIQRERKMLEARLEGLKQIRNELIAKINSVKASEGDMEAQKILGDAHLEINKVIEDRARMLQAIAEGEYDVSMAITSTDIQAMTKEQVIAQLETELENVDAQIKTTEGSLKKLGGGMKGAADATKEAEDAMKKLDGAMADLDKQIADVNYEIGQIGVEGFERSLADEDKRYQEHLATLRAEYGEHSELLSKAEQLHQAKVTKLRRDEAYKQQEERKKQMEDDFKAREDNSQKMIEMDRKRIEEAAKLEEERAKKINQINTFMVNQFAEYNSSVITELDKTLSTIREQFREQRLLADAEGEEDLVKALETLEAQRVERVIVEYTSEAAIENLETIRGTLVDVGLEQDYINSLLTDYRDITGDLLDPYDRFLDIFSQIESSEKAALLVEAQRLQLAKDSLYPEWNKLRLQKETLEGQVRFLSGQKSGRENAEKIYNMYARVQKVYDEVLNRFERRDITRENLKANIEWLRQYTSITSESQIETTRMVDLQATLKKDYESFLWTLGHWKSQVGSFQVVDASQIREAEHNITRLGNEMFDLKQMHGAYNEEVKKLKELFDETVNVVADLKTEDLLQFANRLIPAYMEFNKTVNTVGESIGRVQQEVNEAAEEGVESLFALGMELEERFEDQNALLSFLGVANVQEAKDLVVGIKNEIKSRLKEIAPTRAAEEALIGDQKVLYESLARTMNSLIGINKILEQNVETAKDFQETMTEMPEEVNKRIKEMAGSADAYLQKMKETARPLDQMTQEYIKQRNELRETQITYSKLFGLAKGNLKEQKRYLKLLKETGEQVRKVDLATKIAAQERIQSEISMLKDREQWEENQMWRQHAMRLDAYRQQLDSGLITLEQFIELEKLMRLKAEEEIFQVKVDNIIKGINVMKESIESINRMADSMADIVTGSTESMGKDIADLAGEVVGKFGAVGQVVGGLIGTVATIVEKIVQSTKDVGPGYADYIEALREKVAGLNEELNNTNDLIKDVLVIDVNMAIDKQLDLFDKAINEIHRLTKDSFVEFGHLATQAKGMIGGLSQSPLWNIIDPLIGKFRELYKQNAKQFIELTHNQEDLETWILKNSNNLEGYGILADELAETLMTFGQEYLEIQKQIDEAILKTLSSMTELNMTSGDLLSTMQNMAWLEMGVPAQIEAVNILISTLGSLTDSTNEAFRAFSELSIEPPSALTEHAYVGLVTTLSHLPDALTIALNEIDEAAGNIEDRLDQIAADARGDETTLMQVATARNALAESYVSAIENAYSNEEKRLELTKTATNEAAIDLKIAQNRVEMIEAQIAKAIEYGAKESTILDLKLDLRDATQAVSDLENEGVETAEERLSKAKEEFNNRLAELEHRKKMGEFNNRDDDYLEEKQAILEDMLILYREEGASKEDIWKIEENLYKIRLKLSTSQLDFERRELEHRKKMGEFDENEQEYLDEKLRILQGLLEIAIENNAPIEQRWKLEEEIAGLLNKQTESLQDQSDVEDKLLNQLFKRRNAIRQMQVESGKAVDAKALEEMKAIEDSIVKRMKELGIDETIIMQTLRAFQVQRSFQEGGRSERTGVALIHKGEEVLTAPTVRSIEQAAPEIIEMLRGDRTPQNIREMLSSFEKGQNYVIYKTVSVSQSFGNNVNNYNITESANARATGQAVADQNTRAFWELYQKARRDYGGKDDTW